MLARQGLQVRAVPIQAPDEPDSGGPRAEGRSYRKHKVAGAPETGTVLARPEVLESSLSIRPSKWKRRQ